MTTDRDTADATMTPRQEEAMRDPVTRRIFEEELLLGQTTEILNALLQSLRLPRKELAERLAITRGRVTQILSGGENLTLRSVAAAGWALGIRLRLLAEPMVVRVGTPAENDPPPPRWLTALHPRAAVMFTPSIQDRPRPKVDRARLFVAQRGPTERAA
jgi:hypothetical protein